MTDKPIPNAEHVELSLSFTMLANSAASHCVKLKSGLSTNSKPGGYLYALIIDNTQDAVAACKVRYDLTSFTL